MFYKVQPKNPIGSEKSKFVWLDEMLTAEDFDMTFGMMELSSGFYNGIKSVEPADKNDPDFQAYIKYDLNQVQKELDKLELLKSRLLEVQSDQGE